MDAFVARHRDQITSVLHCFDRVIFHGHLPINYPKALEYFLATQRVELPGFARFVQRHSESLRLSAEEMARRAQRPCAYANGYIRKEEWAHKIARRDGIEDGLVGILRTTEKCRSFTVRPSPKGPFLASSTRRCLHLYFYFIDRQLGWIHVRLQTWFPFLIQIGVNGHEILARQMDRECLLHERIENGFTWIDDPARAQRLADRIGHWHWSRLLDRVAAKINPLLGHLLKPMRYRWSIDQCEFSSDLLFENRSALGPLFRQLVQHANLCFTAEDILGFFGRPLHGLFRGEIQTEQRPCYWGYRIKHRVGKNWIKMYDKAGSILRVETVINHPQDFRIRRTKCRQDGTRVRGLFALPKSVDYLHRFAEIQRRANDHYLRALAAVEDPAAAYARMHELACPVLRHGHRFRGLNPLRPEDRELLLAVLRCEHHLQGFRNEHIRRHIQKAELTDPQARKRVSARVRRQLMILRGHRFIRRVGGKCRRYRVTERGLRIMTAALLYCRQELPAELMKAA